ncbi:phenylacetate--CoA ligase family protein [Actinoplanes regularis]|uniref:Phenylacetate-CoA ligase n=1 Tax=Actinoplanes regularis TaxID=52697 RepID=A0A238XHE7_9ACTN|nr:AMP-binding protein [Actinoplanes regularis]GIE86815.1 capsular polysaccharide biosynthesis protein [Actinoplanes regularis]SNR58110.1 phenylacetate-CoA ligase [Actinoplanes regularis]
MSYRVRAAAGAYWTSQSMQGNSAVRRRLKHLLDTQTWSATDLARLQAEKLCSVIRHAYETVPYYREVMHRRGLRPSDVTDVADLQKLPILTRATVRDHPGRLMSAAAGPDLTRRGSSGSTGQRVEICHDRDFDLWCRAHQLRTYTWCGDWQLGEPFALVWGSPAYFESQTRHQRLDNRVSRRIEINAYRLDHDAIAAILDRLIRHQPSLISGYSTSLYLIARLAARRQIRLPGLRAVQPNAEPLTPAMREAMVGGFGCPVFDKYGSRETNIVAHEAPDHDGMLIQSEHTIVEVVDENDRPVPSGQPGRLLLTQLNNRAMPLIRYETTDLATLLEPHPAGFGFPRMSPVMGRMQDVLCTPHGGLIHPQLFSNILRQFPLIDWFQVVQDRLDHLLIRMVASSGLGDDDRAQITRLIAELTGYPFAIDYERLADMPMSPTGKYRICVSDLPANAVDPTVSALNALRGTS